MDRSLAAGCIRCFVLLLSLFCCFIVLLFIIIYLDKFRPLYLLFYCLYFLIHIYIYIYISSNLLGCMLTTVHIVQLCKELIAGFYLLFICLN